jgi:protein phosphatase
MRLRVGARTDTGRVRALNEDQYVLRVDRGLFMVCDGMGGALAGEVASRLAADIIVERLEAGDGDEAFEDDGYLPRTNRLAAAVRRSNQLIYDQGRQDPRCANMGTTVVGAWLEHYIASVAHVGDSRAYLWHDNQLERLTWDHSLVEAQIRAGIVDEDESLDADEQNVLLRVLGGEPDVDVELSEVPVRPGDYLLLCSDGLTRMVPDATLADAIGRLRDPQRICDYLIEVANGNGGADNITVVVVEIAQNWWRRLAARLKPPFPAPARAGHRLPVH